VFFFCGTDMKATFSRKRYPLFGPPLGRFAFFPSTGVIDRLALSEIGVLSPWTPFPSFLTLVSFVYLPFLKERVFSDSRKWFFCSFFLFPPLLTKWQQTSSVSRDRRISFAGAVELELSFSLFLSPPSRLSHGLVCGFQRPFFSFVSRGEISFSFPKPRVVVVTLLSFLIFTEIEIGNEIVLWSRDRVFFFPGWIESKSRALVSP